MNRNYDYYCNNRDSGNNLLLDIQRISFAIDELRLFLDTHPCCKEARVLFNEYVEKRKELVERYNKEVTPLGGYVQQENDDEWQWNDCAFGWR